MSQSENPPNLDSFRTLLIADDEQNIRRILEALFTKEGYHVCVADSGQRALDIAAFTKIDVLITDLIMPDMNGVELLQKIKAKHPDAVVIMITAYATIKTCVEAMRYGATDYITKPFDIAELRAVVKRAVARQADASSNLPSKIAARKPKGNAKNTAVSPAMLEVEAMVEKAAPSKASVLIRGESGTGKELVARSLHDLSERTKGPFIAIACSALSETLLESELFGHEKNAFTGAMAERKGRFELANGGTLFLDEIGDIAPSVQIKLLRVLQEREFERVGGSKSIRVDVRLVAATNANLERLITEGKFREDLYYRLNVIQIELPPLRGRKEDIPGLVMYFLDRFNKENHRNITSISDQAMMALTSYAWPGNVRELENMVERSVVMCDPNVTELTVEGLPGVIRDAHPTAL